MRAHSPAQCMTESAAAAFGKVQVTRTARKHTEQGTYITIIYFEYVGWQRYGAILRADGLAV